MCPFEVSKTKRGSVRTSYIALIVMAPQAPLPHQSSVESNNTFASRQTSTEDDSREVSVSSEGNLDDRINDILATLSSLTAELSQISRTRHSENLTEVTVEGSANPRRVETTRDSQHRNNQPEAERREGSVSPSVSPSFEKQRVNSSTVRLNVGGKVFHAAWQLLLQVPESRLGRIAQCRTDLEVTAYCDHYNSATNEMFFNQRYRNFIDILDFYRSGSLHISSDTCPIAFVSDLNYWGISMSSLSTCCMKKYLDTKEQIDWEEVPQDDIVEEEWKPDAPEIQRFMWNLFEHPHTSIAARIVGIISVSCIFLSTIILTLDTMPYFEDHQDKIMDQFAPFVIIEAIYMVWFTFEFIIRFACCPSKVGFCKKTMNWIDLLAIVPYFVTVILNYHGVTEQALSAVAAGTEEAGTAKHSTGLQALGNTMKANYKELGLLFLLLGMGAIMFASLIFVFEKEEEQTTFHTMFDSYWWAIITMTTVGYGDVVPITGFGKILGCFCAIFGVLVIALPIPIIGNSFNRFYARQKKWENAATLALNKKSQNLSAVHKASVDETLSVRGL